MNDEDLGFLSIADASEKIALKKLSPIELTEALLRRAEELDPKLNAYLLKDADKAIAAAQAAEKAIHS